MAPEGVLTLEREAASFSVLTPAVCAYVEIGAWRARKQHPLSDIAGLLLLHPSNPSWRVSSRGCRRVLLGSSRVQSEVGPSAVWASCVKVAEAAASIAEH